jgi:hypothetical protein
MIVSPRDTCGGVYLERKKKGWMFVAKVSSHCSLLFVSMYFLLNWFLEVRTR